MGARPIAFKVGARVLAGLSFVMMRMSLPVLDLAVGTAACDRAGGRITPGNLIRTGVETEAPGFFTH